MTIANTSGRRMRTLPQLSSAWVAPYAGQSCRSLGSLASTGKQHLDGDWSRSLSWRFLIRRRRNCGGQFSVAPPIFFCLKSRLAVPLPDSPFLARLPGNTSKKGIQACAPTHAPNASTGLAAKRATKSRHPRHSQSVDSTRQPRLTTLRNLQS